MGLQDLLVVLKAHVCVRGGFGYRCGRRSLGRFRWRRCGRARIDWKTQGGGVPAARSGGKRGPPTRIDAHIAWTDLGSMLDTDPVVLGNSRVTPRPSAAPSPRAAPRKRAPHVGSAGLRHDRRTYCCNPVLPAMGFGVTWVPVASYVLSCRNRNRLCALPQRAAPSEIPETGERIHTEAPGPGASTD